MRAAEVTAQPFQVIEGARSLSRQRQLVKVGASRTLRSRHIPAPNGLAHAVDVMAMVGGKVSWAPAAYHVIADAMRLAARQMGIAIEWGGDFKGFFDGVHFQLPWADYPGTTSIEAPAPPAPVAADLATLLPGSHGEAVVALQNDLTRLGFSLTPDGQFGPRTRAALSAALGKLGLKQTQAVTPIVAARIAKAARANERVGR
jgi:peptidoglycan LD-endopeptidase CwlK